MRHGSHFNAFDNAARFIRGGHDGAFEAVLGCLGQTLFAVSDGANFTGQTDFAEDHHIRRHPLSESLATLRREPSDLFDEQTRLHFRDVADHTEQLRDMLDSYREMAAGLIDMYLSLSSHRMNEVMKVLTVIGSLFIPLTFVTGLYGMNFDHAISPWNMPELHHRYGYPFALTVMLLTTLGLTTYFWRKRWIGKH